MTETAAARHALFGVGNKHAFTTLTNSFMVFLRSASNLLDLKKSGLELACLSQSPTQTVRPAPVWRDVRQWQVVFDLCLRRLSHPLRRIEISTGAPSAFAFSSTSSISLVLHVRICQNQRIAHSGIV